MTGDAHCREVESRLTEAFLARRNADEADARHVEGCRRCAATRSELARLAERLDPPLAELSPARSRAALDAARAALGETPSAESVGSMAGMPPGFGRELARLLVFAALPLPLLGLWYAWLARFGSALLADWLPAFVAPAVGLVFAAAAASWLGLVYGALPFVAHRRALRHAPRHAPRRQEVTA